MVEIQKILVHKIVKLCCVANSAQIQFNIISPVTSKKSLSCSRNSICIVTNYILEKGTFKTVIPFQGFSDIDKSLKLCSLNLCHQNLSVGSQSLHIPASTRRFTPSITACTSFKWKLVLEGWFQIHSQAHAVCATVQNHSPAFCASSQLFSMSCSAPDVCYLSVAWLTLPYCSAAWW